MLSRPIDKWKCRKRTGLCDLLDPPLLITKMVVLSNSPYGRELPFVCSSSSEHFFCYSSVVCIDENQVISNRSIHEKKKNMRQNTTANWVNTSIFLQSCRQSSMCQFTRNYQICMQRMNWRHRQKFGDANGVWYWRECENDEIPFVPPVFYVPSAHVHESIDYLVGTPACIVIKAVSYPIRASVEKLQYAHQQHVNEFRLIVLVIRDRNMWLDRFRTLWNIWNCDVFISGVSCVVYKWKWQDSSKNIWRDPDYRLVLCREENGRNARNSSYAFIVWHIGRFIKRNQWNKLEKNVRPNLQFDILLRTNSMMAGFWIVNNLLGAKEFKMCNELIMETVGALGSKSHQLQGMRHHLSDGKKKIMWICRIRLNGSELDSFRFRFYAWYRNRTLWIVMNRNTRLKMLLWIFVTLSLSWARAYGVVHPKMLFIHWQTWSEITFREKWTRQAYLRSLFFF